MRAKRQILSLLLALLLVWQGFSFANAETGSGAGAVVTAENGTGNGTGREASPASGSIIETGSRVPQQVDALKDIHLYVDGTPVGEGSTLASYSKKISFEATIDKEKIKDVKEGDYISVILPAELKAPETAFEIKGKDKNGIEKVMAKGTYDKDKNEIRIIFTKDAEGYKGDDGKVYFNASVNTSAFTESTSKSLEIVINGGAQNYKINNIRYEIQKDETPISFYKDTAPGIDTVIDGNGNTHHLILYKITLDMRHIEKPAGVTSYENTRIIDTLKSNKLSYFDVNNYKLTEAQKKIYQPKYLKGIWRSGKQNGNQWENAEADDKDHRGPQWKLRSKDNNNNSDPGENTFDFTYTDKNTRRSFTFPLKNLEPDDGYYISYYVEINGGFKNMDSFTNQAKLVGDGIAKELKEKVYSVSEAGGSLNDSQYFNIKIQKTDENRNPLKGAKFKITNPVNKYTEILTSGDDGIAELKDVSKANYTVEETEAPEGYEKDSTIYNITKEDLEASRASGSTITLTIKNKKTEVKKKSTSFSVEKKWVLDQSLATNKPDKVTVSVLKNGVKDDNLTVVLSQENGWKASFSNLPKEGADGREIVYTVSEAELAGFKAAISGTDENGFTISNYNGSRVVIPVTKIWKGNGTHPDHVNVQLFANNEKVATYTLNEGNAWQHSFDMPKLANGKEIRYTVTEENVSGYTATKQNDPATGYVNVFVNTKNDVPPTSPNGGGNGGGGNGGGGNSPKPSPNSSTPPVPSGNTPNPGEVLNASRPSTDSESVSSVLGAEREKTDPKGSVLGAGRGYVKTEDSSSMPIYFLLFALTGLGLTASILWERKKAKH